MALNPSQILIKCIVATHLNRQLESPLVNVNQLVDEAIELAVPKNNALMGDASDADIIESLKLTLQWLREAGEDLEIPFKDLESTIKLNNGFECDYIEAVVKQIGSDIDQKSDEDKKRKISMLLSELNFAIKKKRIEKMLRKAQRDLSGKNSTSDMDSYFQEFSKDLEGETKTKDGNFPGFVGSLETDNPESIEEVAKSTKVLNSDEGTLTIPLQGLSDALGGVNVRRGDMYCAKARSNMYKSGHLLDLTMWLPRYNKPYMRNEKKKPLMLRVSFENTPEQDFNTMITKIKEGAEQKKIDISKIDTKQAVKEFCEYVEVNGYKVAVVCFDPNKFDVWKLIDVLNYYELQGYEIHGVICDYLEIVTRTTRGERQDSVIANAFEITRNHCMPRRIAFFTAHQLNTASGELLAEVGSAAFAKRVANSGGLYDHNCRSLIQKLDVEVVLHRHSADGTMYLCFGVGKLRERVVDEKLKSFYYPFQKFGGIVPDHDEEESKAIYNLSTVNTGGTDGISGEGVAW